MQALLDDIISRQEAFQVKKPGRSRLAGYANHLTGGTRRGGSLDRGTDLRRVVAAHEQHDDIGFCQVVFYGFIPKLTGEDLGTFPKGDFARLKHWGDLAKQRVEQRAVALVVGIGDEDLKRRCHLARVR